MAEKLRIYVGGLGSNVQEDDLKKTFTSPHLGTVETVEIIRSKGRSFGYLEFLPASDKGLANLFSKYNGCMWKGGRLKLEKAKEHYLFRLTREWTEDAELASKLSSQNVHADESMNTLQGPKKNQDIEKMQLRIFFPKLRKIKPIPLKGTGRHKYSFQRIEIPPLPIHFCDCEEHSGPPESVKKNCTDGQETETCGVNEEELNMMKSILNKLLEKENHSKTDEAEVTEEINHNVTSADNGQVDDIEEDQVSDEDNLVINMVGQPGNRVALFEDWGQRTTATNQDSLLREPESFDRSTIEMHGNKKRKLLPEKKKQSLPDNDTNDTVPSKSKARKGNPRDSMGDLVAVNTQPRDTKSGSIQLSRDVASSQKAAWKDLVSERGSTAFHISDVLIDLNPEVEAQPRSDHLAAPHFSEKDSLDDESSEDEELEKLPDVQSSKPSAFEEKSARGSAWLQKSSWLQLVGDTNNSAFNLAQILPGATFEKQELQQFNDNNFSDSKNAKQHRFVHKNQNSPIGDIRKPQGRANEDIYAAPGDPNVEALNKGQNLAGLDGEGSNSDLKQTVEQKDVTSAQMPGSDLIANNRASVEDIVISETCPFMRTAASMKEWVKTKTALSSSHKKKGKAKEPVID